jgi:phage baseplate assembly protein gpV
VVALVTQNDDTLGRVKLKFPWMADNFETDWVRVASLGAGPRTGAVWLPQVDDEVLVAFEFGDFRRPYVVGGLWNGIDKPPLGDGLFDNGSVKRRGFVSRKGHRMVFLDGDGDEGIAILSSKDKLKIALKESATEIHVKSDGTIVIESTGALTIKGSADVSSRPGGLTLKGATVRSRGPCRHRRQPDPAELSGANDGNAGDRDGRQDHGDVRDHQVPNPASGVPSRVRRCRSVPPSRSGRWRPSSSAKPAADGLLRHQHAAPCRPHRWRTRSSPADADRPDRRAARPC